MSEAEIKKRQDYKRNRKKWILIQATAIVVLLIIMLGSFIIYDRMNRTYYIEYTENSVADYKVKYIENDFFDEEWVGSGQSYVSSLIENLFVEFKYDLNMNSSNIGFEYNYDIKAQLIVSDKTTGDHIYSPTDVLISSGVKKAKRSNGFAVNQNVFIDFNKYNSEAKSFVETYGLKNATSMLVVTMNVNVESQCEEFETNNNNYSVSLNVPLCEENFSIFTTASSPAGETKQLACKGAVNQKIFLTSGIVCSVIALVLGCVLLAFVYLTRNEDVNYAIKVRKILSSYRSFIQQIEGEFDTEGYQLIAVKTFTEMLGIRDTIQSPVLMSENKDETKTQFLIPTNTKLLYVFEIKVENYDLIYGLDEEHHGKVVEFEDEQGVEEAIIFDEEINLEDVAEAMATPDVILADVDYVEDNDVDYEGTEEAPSVEVVGVVWPERAHKNKVYRYDPNGENLHEGDMVLVPTRDAAREREVIRKAAIAHANHNIDPTLHPHPLKKIIGVIKRRAEAALTPSEPSQNEDNVE